jgi:lipopolysaccharide export system permease protein
VKILDRYILKSFITTFATVFVILFLIFILQTVWLFIGELAGKDLDLGLIAKFLLFKMPSVVPLVLPLSIVLSSIMTFGSFAENYEFAAMKSAGISLTRAMRGLSIFIAVLSLATFLFANNVIPYAEYKFINFRRNIAQVKPAMAIAEGQFNDVGTYNIKVDKKSGENGNLLSGITIHKKSTQDFGNNSVVIQAKNGELVSNEDSNILKLVLNDGNYYEDITPKKREEKDKKPFAKSSFKKYVINIDLSKLNQTDLNDEKITNTNTMLNVGELTYTIDSLSKDYKKDIVSFSDNIYQRTGISATRKTIVALPAPSTEKTPELLSLLDEDGKREIFKVAAGNVANTIFTIEGSKTDQESKQKNLNGHYIALYDKFVIAFSCFLMFFIGAPLGAIIRKGGLGLPIVFAVLIFITFHFINTFGKKVAQENGITPFFGTWMSTIVLLPLAIMLTYRATKDMSISINFDWITIPFQKLFTKNTPELQPVVNLETINPAHDAEWEKLEQSSDHILTGIVKNSKQFQYTEDYRNKALKILDSRGITQQDLLDHNDLDNTDYRKIEQAQGIYKLYAITAIVTNITAVILTPFAVKGNMVLMLLGFICLFVFYFSAYYANESMAEIEKLVGKKIGVSVIVTLLVGFPLYIFIFIYNKIAMKEALSEYNYQ